MSNQFWRAMNTRNAVRRERKKDQALEQTRLMFPCATLDCPCGGCIGECAGPDGCPEDAPCRKCWDQLLHP